MIRSCVALAAVVTLFTLPYAGADEPAPMEARSPLELRLALPALPPRYGEAVQVDLLVTNRSKTVAHFFHDHRMSGALRIELTDRHGVTWRATPTPATLFLTQAPPRSIITYPPNLKGSRYGTVLPIQPGQRLRLSMRVSHFVPVSAPGDGRGLAWLSSLAPGEYTLRVTYRKDDINIPVGPAKVNPRLLQILPPFELQPYPGLFTGRLRAETTLTVVAPSVSVVDQLKQRIRELEAENKRMRTALDKVRAALAGQ